MEMTAPTTPFTLQRGADGALRLAGDLGFATAAAAHAAGVGALSAAPAGELRVDCSGLVETDSAGLAVLLEWCAVARGRGVTLRFEALPETLQRLARISEVETLLRPAA
jgi:phospholipid transport system transporter-binding protein